MLRGTLGVRQYAGRTSDQIGDSFGYTSELKIKFKYKLFNKLRKFISSSYELRFRRSLYPRVGETTLYNFRLDSVG